MFLRKFLNNIKNRHQITFYIYDKTHKLNIKMKQNIIQKKNTHTTNK